MKESNRPSNEHFTTSQLLAIANGGSLANDLERQLAKQCLSLLDQLLGADTRGERKARAAARQVAELNTVETTDHIANEWADMATNGIVMKILIKFSSDWADEFTCEQMQIVEDASTDLVKSRIEKNLLEAQGFYFGTNEGWEGGELMIDRFTFTELSDQEADIILKHFGKNFGTGIIRQVLKG